DGVTGLDQVRSHRAAHIAQAHPSDRRHRMPPRIMFVSNAVFSLTLRQSGRSDPLRRSPIPHRLCARTQIEWDVYGLICTRRIRSADRPGDLLTLLAVARLGKFTAAAHSLGLNHTTVSRRIAALEKAYGERVLVASPDGW